MGKTIGTEAQELQATFNKMTGQMTTQDIVNAVKQGLAGFSQYALTVRHGLRLTPNDDSVYISYASAPAGTLGVDWHNAKTAALFKIESPAKHDWPNGGPAPAKVTVEHFSGSIRTKKDWDKSSKVVFRKKTASPEVAIKYLVDFFHKNRAAMEP